jgi:hypothetical protein
MVKEFHRLPLRNSSMHLEALEREISHIQTAQKGQRL